MKLRLQITKDASIRFISHLEYLRTLERAVRRSKIPAAYSEGFNPHLKISLASALGVGVVSYAEFLELELAEPMEAQLAVKQLRAVMPVGIRIVAADLAPTNAKALMAEAGLADYVVKLPCANDPAAAIAAFNAAPELMFVKSAPKTKSGVKEIDVKQFIKTLTAKYQDGELELSFSCRITPEGSMKAADLLQTLNQYYNLELPVAKADITRTGLYRVDRKMQKCPLLSAE